MKKVVTLAGIAVLSIGILAGCGGDKSSSASNNSASTSTSSSSSSQSSSQTSGASATASSGSAKALKIEGSNYKMDVAPVEIKAGDKVNLTFSTKEGVHGYAIKNTNIKFDAVASGTTKTAEWTPDKPGEYEVYCTMVCGPMDKHEAMKSKIVVK